MVVVHCVTAPALVFGHMDGHVHLFDDGHMHLLVDGDVLDNRHMLDDVHRHMHLLGVVMMDGVHLVRHVNDDVLTASGRWHKEYIIFQYKYNN